jgi:hypothetical protein
VNEDVWDVWLWSGGLLGIMSSKLESGVARSWAICIGMTCFRLVCSSYISQMVNQTNTLYSRCRVKLWENQITG